MPDSLAVALPAPPARRAECIEGPRPCPWSTCRYHLRVERRGLQAAKADVTQETCALDLAERGGMKLQEVADVLGVTRERVRQIELRALERIRPGVAHLVATG